jgi:hypothetical protein
MYERTRSNQLISHPVLGYRVFRATENLYRPFADRVKVFLRHNLSPSRRQNGQQRSRSLRGHGIYNVLYLYFITLAPPEPFLRNTGFIPQKRLLEALCLPLKRVSARKALSIAF